MPTQKEKITIRYTVHADQAAYPILKALGDDNAAIRRRLNMLLHIGALVDENMSSGVRLKQLDNSEGADLTTVAANPVASDVASEQHQRKGLVAGVRDFLKNWKKRS